MRRDAELGTEVGLQKTSCGLHSEIQPALNTASLGLFSPNHSFISSAKEEYSRSKFPAPKNESVCAPEQRVGRWLLGKRQGRSRTVGAKGSQEEAECKIPRWGREGTVVRGRRERALWALAC